MSPLHLGTAVGFSVLVILLVWVAVWAVIDGERTVGRDAFFRGRPLDPGWTKWAQQGWRRAAATRDQMKRERII